MIDVIALDERFIVCIKPFRVLSTDGRGGLPELLRGQLGLDTVLTVHRLDRVVGGLMVLARDKQAAAAISGQIMAHSFQKEYLAVVHGSPEQPRGEFTDLLIRDRDERKTYVTDEPSKDARRAELYYETLASAQDMSLVRIELRTGRTHQIRAQFSSRCLPLYGDRKYSLLEDEGEIALWSHRLCFTHPESGEPLSFTAPPPETFPWTLFPRA